MKITQNIYLINGISIGITATEYEEGDKQLLRNLYNQWLDLNISIKKISTRGINIPEAISENAFCLASKNCVRVVKLKEGKCSFDVLNIDTGKKIQIKASSIGEDLTSFGPRSEWDELFFLDFSKNNGIFNIYKIEPDWVYKHKINATQTFEDQQKLGIRPRFSIVKYIIIPRNLKPIVVNMNTW